MKAASAVSQVKMNSLQVATKALLENSIKEEKVK